MVVVYASAVPWWASRLWWMLKANGHDKVAVLDGGLKKWRDEGRAITTDVPTFDAAAFMPRQRPEMIADKARVQAALAADEGAVINALSPQLHRGESDLGYGRPGRIAGSVNLSALALIDQDTGAYLPEGQLRQAVTDELGEITGAAICYCGGGIAATMDALVLDILGHKNVAVYDASLSEWAADHRLPMETG
jgi:thiosulfate/3-mercaptopyruvate sulfurtransferase